MSESPGMGMVIKELLGRDAFVPFIVVMNSGNRYEVRFPELAVLGRSLMTLARPRSQRQDVLRLTEVSSVEILDPE